MTDFINSIFANPEAVGINKICNVIDSIFDSTGGTLLERLSKFFNAAGKISTYIIAFALYKNYDKVWKLLKFIILKFVYNRVVLDSNINKSVIARFTELTIPVIASTSSTNEKDKTIVNPRSNEIWISGLPLYLEKEGNDDVIYHFSFFHSKFIDELYLYAQKEKEDISVETVCRDENGKIFKPLELFASDNYLKVDKICSRYFNTFEATKMLTPLILAGNSPPGHGKTGVIHYLGNMKKYKEIRLFDLTSSNMINKGFSSIVAELLNKEVFTPTIICFDELDKYIVLYTQHIFTSQQKGLRKETENCKNMDEVVDSDFSTFEKQVKRSVINTINQLSNAKNYHKGVIFMLLSNNIHTIFNGLNQLHINSTKTRLTFIDFMKVNRNELSRYITEFNNRLTDPEQKYQPVRLRAALRKIRYDIDITYRDIQICMNKAAYDIDKLIEYINEGIDNPLFNYDENGTDIIPIGLQMERSVIGGKGEAEGQYELNIVDKIESVKTSAQKSRERRKEKEEIIIDILNLIHNVNNETELSPLSDDEIINKMNELSNGYNLVKLSEMVICYDQDYYNITQHSAYYNPNILEYLLNLGVNPNLTIGNSNILRKVCHNPKSALLLLKHGADCGEEFRNALGSDRHGLYAQDSYTTILKYIIEEKGFDINSKLATINISSKIISYSTRWNIDKLLDCLVELGLTMENINNIFRSVISQSINADSVKAFLNRGVNVDVHILEGMSIMYVVILSKLPNKDKKELIDRILQMNGGTIKLHQDIEYTRDKLLKGRVPEDIVDMLPDSMF